MKRGKPSPLGTPNIARMLDRTAPGKKQVRLLEVEGLLAARVSIQQIRASLCAKWGVEPHTIDKYVAKCRGQWREDRETNRESARDRMRATLDQGHSRAMGKGDLAAAVQYTRVMVALDGLDQPRGPEYATAQNENDGWDLDALSLEELQALAAMRKKASSE